MIWCAGGTVVERSHAYTASAPGQRPYRAVRLNSMSQWASNTPKNSTSTRSGHKHENCRCLHYAGGYTSGRTFADKIDAMDYNLWIARLSSDKHGQLLGSQPNNDKCNCHLK